ncbi:alpha-mannosidase [Gracilibacillus suaedae]|uniref:alpha-mannosidase n=1 Tax=Gracilibacillus suaedae TaxID=2820273 RepID=UPI001ABE976F|nr:alpha-mannosidase [Gracilibacillus suaedae]
MFLTEKKLNARIQEIEKFRYRDVITLDEWVHTIDHKGEIGTYPPDTSEESTKIKLGDHWSGRDLYVWLTKEVHIPRDWQFKKIVARFDFGDTGAGNNSGFESLLFLNNHPYQGVDSNHREVFLSSNHIGEKVKFDLRLWSGLEGGGKPQEQHYRFKHASIACIDEIVDGFYFDAKVMLETLQHLAETQTEKQQLTQILNKAIHKIDWLTPGSDSFYQSVYEASDYLSDNLNQLEKHSDVIFHCIGHTHIDVAWLWRLKHTREKSARSFSTVLRLMEQYPDYLFLQSQPQLYEYIKHDYPEIYQNIKRKVGEGQWEVEGGMWVEADCNIPSGESLVRQLLLGTRFFKEEFDKKNEVLWLPDVFGYSWALPQILRKSGFTSFMTTKISWNQFNRMPHDTFFWKGIDGSEILTHFITTTEPWPESTYYTYNGYMQPNILLDSWQAYKDKNVNTDLLLAYGYGDGGGGVNRDMLEVRKRMDQLPALPKAKPSTVSDYFEKLRNTIANTEEYVHTWDGELYLEFHRGTYTSQAFMKKNNRKLELAYRESEWLNSLVAIEEGFSNYPGNQLTAGWKIILRNQFHDIIPGSSIKEVYEDAKVEYEEAEHIVEQTINEALKVCVAETESNSYTIINSSSWQRDDWAFIPNEVDGTWRDHTGNLLKSQATNDGVVVYVTDIPALGVASISREEHTKDRILPAFKEGNNSMDSPFYTISWNTNGQLTSIWDKKANRELLQQGQVGNDLQIFEDKPLMFDAWDIDIFYQEKIEHVHELIHVDCTESGDIFTTVHFEWRYGKSTIKQDMILYADNPRIDFETYVDWKERQRLLKVAFPVDIRATEATYDIQYGNVNRPTHWNTSWDYARFETVGHKWADISEAGYGVSLLNDSKYGYDIKDSTMRLSLLKSPVYPDPEADLGEHTFTYALLPHTNDWREAKVHSLAYNLNAPLRVTKGTFKGSEESFIKMDEDHIEIDTVKKAEDEESIIVRLHEFHGRRGNISLTCNKQITSWTECDLMENSITDEQKTNTVDLFVKPYEIKTIRIKF